MWSINFAYLRSRYPSLNDAFDVIEDWLTANRNIRHLEVVRVVRWKPGTDPLDLSSALNAMVREGILKVSWGVRGPDETLAAEGFFDRVEEIPYRLHTTSDKTFRKKDGDIIPIYREATAV